VLNEDVCQAKAPLKAAGAQVCCDLPRRNAQLFGAENLLAATLGVPTINTLTSRGFTGGDCNQQSSRATGDQLMTVR